MLDQAHANGGDLLKFGGDALLLFFHGEQHALRAANTSVSMRAALVEAAKVPTSVGRLNLSMSVGIHSGEIDFFLIGERHRELAILGPGANELIKTEGAAQAGQILLSTGAVAALPSGSSRVVDGNHMLRWRSPKPAADFDRSDPTGWDNAHRLFPDSLGQYLAARPPEPEHRIACIGFIRISGTDAMLDREGGSRLAQVLHDTLSMAQQVFAEEQVTLLTLDVDRDGFKLFLGAGVPHSLADDEGVMLRAVRRVVDAGTPLDIQVGLNRGHVFVAEVGTPRRAAYSAMGDTTNTAARICAKAPPGRIYAHPSVLDESLTVFEVTPSEPLVMKGKAAPLVVYDVGELTGVREREGIGVAEFIGRTQELADLAERLEDLRHRTGHALGIVGESGLGKTRLAREALSGYPEFSVHVIRPEPYAANRQYRAARDLIRGVLDIPTVEQPIMRETLLERLSAYPELEAYASLIGEAAQIDVPPSPEELDIEPRFRPDRIAELIVQVLTRFLEGPQIFMIDDAHWCDEASANLFRRIAAACQDQPWLLLSARRDVLGGLELDEQLHLSPLSDEDVETLVEIATEAAPLLPHDVARVVERASGNPLFATEILQAAREAGSIDDLPVSLEAVLISRIDGLDRPARRLLRSAAVLGRSFPREVLVELVSDEEPYDEDVMARLAEFLEINETGRISFLSGMVRDSAYEAIAFAPVPACTGGRLRLSPRGRKILPPLPTPWRCTHPLPGCTRTPGPMG